MNKLLMT